MRLTTLLILVFGAVALMASALAVYGLISTQMNCADGHCPWHWSTVWSASLMALVMGLAAFILARLR